jgi:hypothetical protein
MWERVLDSLNSVISEPPAPLLPLMCAARRGPTTMSWLAPPIRARDQAGRQRPSLWPLDARWGQSNTPILTKENRDDATAQTSKHSCITRDFLRLTKESSQDLNQRKLTGD